MIFLHRPDRQAKPKRDGARAAKARQGMRSTGGSESAQMRPRVSKTISGWRCQRQVRAITRMGRAEANQSELGLRAETSVAAAVNITR
jgi:hypothetical protein